MDIMESIEGIELYNRSIKRSHSFLYNALRVNKIAKSNSTSNEWKEKNCFTLKMHYLSGII